MTRAELAEKVRWICEEYGLDWLKAAGTASRYDLGDALSQAYIKYARKTKCFLYDFSINGVVGTSVYTYSGLSSYNTWAQGTDYALGAVVVPATANGHKYICTVAGTS